MTIKIPSSVKNDPREDAHMMSILSSSITAETVIFFGHKPSSLEVPQRRMQQMIARQHRRRRCVKCGAIVVQVYGTGRCTN